MITFPWPTFPWPTFPWPTFPPGAQPRRPADWRQERVPADLAFSLGQELGSSTKDQVG
jgi:hypothetical protein